MRAEMTALGTTARHSLLYFVARAAPAGVLFAISVLSIRFLGGEAFVEFSLTLALVLGVGVFSTAWLNQSIARELHGPRGEALVDGLAGKGAAVVALVTFPPLWLVAEMVLRPIEPSVLLLLPLHAANVFYLVALGCAITRSRPETVLAGEVLRSIVMAASCLGVILVAPRDAAQWILAGIALSLVVGTARIIPPLRGAFGAIPSPRELIGLFRRDGMICLWFAAATLLFLVDRFLLKDLIGPAVAAPYILLADTIQRGAQFLLAPMIIALQPIVARQLRGGAIGATYETIGRALLLQGAAAALALVFVLSCRDLLLELLIGTVQPDVKSSFLPLLIAATLWQAAQVIQKPLEYTGHLVLLAGIAAAAVAVVVVATMAGAHRFGIVAAAWGSAAAVTLYVVATGVFAVRLRRRQEAT